MSKPKAKCLVQRGTALFILLCMLTASYSAQEVLPTDGLTYMTPENGIKSSLLTLHPAAVGEVRMHFIPTTQSTPDARLMIVSCEGTHEVPAMYETPIETVVRVAPDEEVCILVAPEERGRFLSDYLVRTVFYPDRRQALATKDVEEDEDEVVAGFTACSGNDLPTCADPIGLGRIHTDDVGLEAEDVEDFFTFQLDSLETVVLSAISEEAVGVSLYDEVGQELLKWSTCEDDCAVRRTRTLGPGVFTIGVREQDAGASYALSVNKVNLR